MGVCMGTGSARAGKGCHVHPGVGVVRIDVARCRRGGVDRLGSRLECLGNRVGVTVECPHNAFGLMIQCAGCFAGFVRPRRAGLRVPDGGGGVVDVTLVPKVGGALEYLSFGPEKGQVRTHVRVVRERIQRRVRRVVSRRVRRVGCGGSRVAP